MRRPRALLLLVASAFVAAAFVACGSRTGLLVGEVAIATDASQPKRDARILPFDGDLGEDTLPGLDATPPRDADRSQCADAGATLIYVVSNTDELLAFDHAAATFQSIAHLVCPDGPPARHPFSMAVDRFGVAYVLYADPAGAAGSLYRVSLATGACVPTAFNPGANSFQTFGMGFAANDTDPGETLFIADDNNNGRLGTIDVKSFTVGLVGTFVPTVTRGELTGTGDGRLFAFYSKDLNGVPGGSSVAQIDKKSARVIAETLLPSVEQGQAWAFGFWGGDFYLFTSTAGSSDSQVTRFRPTDGTIANVATYVGGEITGAGVSTCAPSQ